MDPATAQLLISGVIRALDLLDRISNSFDSTEELNAYIEERNALRNELVRLSTELGQSESAPNPVPDNDGPTSEPELPAEQEDEDASASDAPQG